MLEGKAALLLAPSAMVPGERNWLINPAHLDSEKIKLLETEPFSYDVRLLS